MTSNDIALTRNLNVAINDLVRDWCEANLDASEQVVFAGVEAALTDALAMRSEGRAIALSDT